MDSRYSYDENSQTWPVFTLSVLVVALVPFSIHSIYKLAQSEQEPLIKGSIDIKESQIDQKVRVFRAKTKKSKIFTKRNLFLLIGWVLVAVLVYQIKTTEFKPSGSSGNFDPYELLDIEFGATEKEIKSHYKKLSVKFHPDKIKNVSDEEKAELEERFVLITKAYKSLTDEATRENYEKYGHPDGPQTVSHGIALPKFLIEGKSSPLLLTTYFLLIGFVLPYIVNRWWSKTKSYTKKGIHTKTAALFVDKILEHKPSKIPSVSLILDWLSEATEYEHLFPKKSTAEVRELFDDYLNRKINQETLELVSITPVLISGLIDFTASFRSTELSLATVDTLRHLIQAVPQSTHAELLQLPNVDPKTVKSGSIKRLGKLLTLSNTEQQKTLGIQDELKLKETLAIATKIPILKLVKAEFKVVGESVVTPSSTAYISIKVAVRSAKHHGDFKLDKNKLIEEETPETLRNPYKIVTDQPRLPKTFAPFFPVERSNGFISLITLQKDSKICEAPAIFKNLDVSNLELTSEEYVSGEKVVIGTFKIPLTQVTPPQPGNYEFRVILKSTDYFVSDLDFPLVMKVENPPKIEEIDYDIPDPEEDSIAGALATIRGEKVSKIGEDSDDDESDFEDEESDFSDINTDTEDEYEDEEKITK